MLQAILDEIKNVNKKMDERFNSVDVRLNEIDKKLDRIEQNEPKEVMSMLKLINKNIERDHSYNDKNSLV